MTELFSIENIVNLESYSRLNGWKMHLETVMESLLEPFSNEGFDIDSAEEVCIISVEYIIIYSLSVPWIRQSDESRRI